MADPTGFLKYGREEPKKKSKEERLATWGEVYADVEPAERNEKVRKEASRCMDCGIPFCHSGGAGCPLGNLIPEWNDLVRRGDWAAASDRLHATNNFPEFTGKPCPAPCAARPASPDHAYYSQVKDRLGGKRATLSMARKIARRSHHILRELGDQTLAPV